MELELARTTLGAIGAERERRIRGLPKDTYAALTHWSDVDDPFVAELVLLLLVAVFHQVERELIWLAAGHSVDGVPIEFCVYQERAAKERRRWSDRKKRTVFIRQFGLEALDEWNTIEALRLVANCYKHDPHAKPNTALLRHLGMPPVPVEPLVTSYAALAESQNFREGFASWLNLDRQGNYCEIALEVLDRVEAFLAAAGRAMPRNVNPGRVSMTSFEG